MNAVELAASVGLSYAYLRELLDGKRNISALIIEDIAVRLNVPLGVLLCATFHQEPEPITLQSRWGARRGRRDDVRNPRHDDPAQAQPRKDRN